MVKITRAVNTNYNNWKYTSLAVVSGNPAISFQAGNGLWYVRANDADGTTWSSAQLIESVGSGTGGNCSLAVVDGRPAISYHDQYEGLKFVQANDGNGALWGTPITLDTG
ncbi:MAG: hypothetical protein GKR87_11645 [Kiritimatiellae bacterium]|nr:hypothetical protein [Kiritimatiellia bacterium]